jgi:hypothetical protein
MHSRLHTLPLWVAAAWAGSLTTLGFFVVPMLFANLPTPTMAGTMAGKLFSAQTSISVACTLVLLAMVRTPKFGVSPRLASTLLMLVLAGAVLSLLVEFGVSPHIIARDNLALWHRVGTAMYAAQWVCALLVFGKLAGDRA